ncbi:MAG: hypothetical protein ACREUL_18550 [Steroidobacteraceae bacterium]
MAARNRTAPAAAHSRNPSRPAPAYTLTITASPSVPGKSFAEVSLDALVDAFTRWRDETGFGASDIGARWPVFHGGARVGVLSYNGRFAGEVSP